MGRDREFVERARRSLVRRLGEFPLYREGQSLVIGGKEEKLYVVYREHTITVEEATGFCSNIENQNGERVCDVLWFWIREGLRRMGHGRKMYEDVVESFAIEQGCRRVITNPSGEGLEFWPAMGFREIEGSNMFEKVL
jgi:GNAT superfamily N-acetyltransferase